VIPAVHARYVLDTSDVPEAGNRDGVRIERALPLWSKRLVLPGRADVGRLLRSCAARDRLARHRCSAAHPEVYPKRDNDTLLHGR
jgi:hypothetical protein